jgi:hypothetical protein
MSEPFTVVRPSRFHTAEVGGSSPLPPTRILQVSRGVGLRSEAAGPGCDPLVTQRNHRPLRRPLSSPLGGRRRARSSAPRRPRGRGVRSGQCEGDAGVPGSGCDLFGIGSWAIHSATAVWRGPFGRRGNCPASVTAGPQNRPRHAGARRGVRFRVRRCECGCLISTLRAAPCPNRSGHTGPATIFPTSSPHAIDTPDPYVGAGIPALCRPRCWPNPAGLGGQIAVVVTRPHRGVRCAVLLSAGTRERTAFLGCRGTLGS